MKFVKPLLIFSMIISANYANAQDEPAKQSAGAVVEGKNVSVAVMQKQLKALEAELEKVQAEAVRHAQQLQSQEQALAKRDEVITQAKQQALQARKQVEQAKQVAEDSVREAELAIAKALAEAVQAKASQELGIGQYKALLQLAEKKQGPEHAYSQQLKMQLMKLETELAAISQQYGPGHPKVQQTKEQAKMLAAQLKKIKPEATVVFGQPNKFMESPVANLKAIEEALAKVHWQNLRTNPEAAEELRARIADESVKAQLSALNESRMEAERVRSLYERQIVSRGEVAAKENAVAMQLRRTQEMLEMQKRLLSAENVARTPVVAARNINAGGSIDRFERLEQKLDKIASLLEKLIGAEE